MKRLLTVLVPICFILLGAAAPADAAFGVNEFNLAFAPADGSPALQAGSHPGEVVTDLGFKTRPLAPFGEYPDGSFRNLEVTLPEGLVGRPSAVPRCSATDFAQISHETGRPPCPDSSAVGTIIVKALYQEANGASEPHPSYTSAPVWNLTPSSGAAQSVGFWLQGVVPVRINFLVSQEAPYRIIAQISDTSQTLPIYKSKLTLWGNPASPVHDRERGDCVRASVLSPLNVEELNLEPGCSISAGTPESAFITMPTVCGAPLTSSYLATSWEGEADAGSVEGQMVGGCEGLAFEPSITADPTAHSGQTASGFGFSLDVSDEGITNPVGVAQSDIRRTEVTLPEGMNVNPSLASGLAACSIADLQRETLAASPGEGCPQASKIGSAQIETPLLEEALSGNLYVAQPFENEAGSLLAVYLVIRNQKLGVIIKQTIKVIPSASTGQLTAVADNIPQLPFSHFRLNFRSGERGPLTTPTNCGSYPATAVITPWSGGPQVTSTSMFRITTGPAGGTCGGSPFAPSFEAGTVSPIAGSKSPFVLNLSRAAGSPRLSSVEATLPKGLLGKLAGVAECSDAQIATAQSRNAPNQGALELAAPSCPSGSQLGTVTVGAGSGTPTYVQGKAYLAGPYKGAPLSLVIITPAVTGPFDLGTVVVRNALYVNPTTAQIRAVSDPLPTILQGIPLDIRSISVNLDRPDFTLNPTSCIPMAVLGGANSLLGQASMLESHFQVGGCGGLAFSPKLTLALSGATKRSGNPALRAVLKQPKGQAGIRRVSTVLPRSEFIDNAHIANPCTRVQFNEDRCPKSSILGKATAYSPLLDKPLTGPVYFRSNGGERELPDLVAALHGQIDVNLVGFIDSVKKKGAEVSRVRTRFNEVPDAPVSKFVLQLFGGKRGLLENSTNLCKGMRTATIKFTGQNGKQHNLQPRVQVKCGKARKK